MENFSTVSNRNPSVNRMSADDHRNPVTSEAREASETTDRLLRVVVADDDDTVRHDLRRLLELEADIEVVAVAHNGQHAIEHCHNHRPDVVILDIRMPVMDGIAATQVLRHPSDPLVPTPAVLILTTFDLDDYVLAAIRVGAAGFMLKDQAPEHLAAAVRTVANGDAVLGPRATARLLEEFAQPRVVQSPSLALLTPRERDVLELVAKGLSNDEVSEALYVSVPTVKTHVSNLLTKLNLENRVQVVVWAYENRVVTVREA
jgi:DNA-binding NarL/FixJ family response regulator